MCPENDNKNVVHKMTEEEELFFLDIVLTYGPEFMPIPVLYIYLPPMYLILPFYVQYVPFYATIKAPGRGRRG